MDCLLALFSCIFARIKKTHLNHNKPHPSSLAAAPRTFPRFLELPAELQIMIWREAATPEEHFRLDNALFRELEWRVYPNLDISGWSRAFLRLVEGRELCGVIRVIGNPGGGERGRAKRMIEVANAIRKARSSLRRTCRTARFITFEVWKRDVAAITMVVGTLDEGEEVERWKSKIRNIVDWLILFNGIALPYVKPHRRVRQVRCDKFQRPGWSYSSIYNIRAPWAAFTSPSSSSDSSYLDILRGPLRRADEVFDEGNSDWDSDLEWHDGELQFDWEEEGEEDNGGVGRTSALGNWMWRMVDGCDPRQVDVRRVCDLSP